MSGRVISPSGVPAFGVLRFSANPTNGDTIVLNGTTITFRTSATAPDVTIGSTLLETLSNAVNALNANATFSAVNFAMTSTGLILATYKSVGSAGNAFTLAKSSSAITIQDSATTLTGGVNPGGLVQNLNIAPWNLVDSSTEKFVMNTTLNDITLQWQYSNASSTDSMPLQFNQNVLYALTGTLDTFKRNREFIGGSS